MLVGAVLTQFLNLGLDGLDREDRIRIQKDTQQGVRCAVGDQHTDAKNQRNRRFFESEKQRSLSLNCAVVIPQIQSNPTRQRDRNQAEYRKNVGLARFSKEPDTCLLYTSPSPRDRG